MENWRYGRLYKVTLPDREPVLIAAVDGAVTRRITEELGVPEREAIAAQVEQPTADEVAGYCERVGESVRMAVKHPAHGRFECNAICREDALLQACTQWDADFISMLHDVQTRYFIINRVPVRRE